MFCYHQRCFHFRRGISREAVNAAGVIKGILSPFLFGMMAAEFRFLKKFKLLRVLFLRPEGNAEKDSTNGINIFCVKAWDYAGMCEVFDKAITSMRETRIPALFHVEEVTQPQGIPTSGSHERYKTPEPP